MIFKGYTKRDTSILKGFAILCIVFHNFFHWLPPSPGENEFVFSALRIQQFFHLLGEQPAEFANIILSYLGHYGVQLFIMISGFGLAMSMMRKEQSWGVFVLDRLKKLYPLLITGIVVFILATIVLTGHSLKADEWRELGWKMLFIHTLLPNSGISLNGPWWFFGMIFQLYLLFPWLYRLIRRWKGMGFAGVCLVSYGLIFLFLKVFNLHGGFIVMQNSIGHLPEFCLGILLAFSVDKRIHWLWLILAVAMFCLGNVFSWAYPFTFLSLTLIAVFAYQGLKSLPGKKGWIGNPLAYFGALSMMLFVVNGPFRAPFLTLAGVWDTLLGHLAAGLLFFAFVWLISIGAMRLYECLLKGFSFIPAREFKGGRWLQRVVQVLLILFFGWVMTYYIRQDLAKNPSTPLQASTLVEQGQFNGEELYVTLSRMPLEHNPLVIQIKGGFDYKALDGETTPPYVVIDIHKHLWELPALRKRPEGEWTHYEFDFDYLRPFNYNIADNELKVYIWNRDKKEAQFRKFSIFASY